MKYIIFVPENLSHCNFNHLSISLIYRDLHSSTGWTISDVWSSNSKARGEFRGCFISVQPQCPEAPEQSSVSCWSTRGLRWRRRLCVLQCHPAPEERRPCGCDEERRSAGHHPGQRGSVHLQRPLPVWSAGAPIAEVSPGHTEDLSVSQDRHE